MIQNLASLVFLGACLTTCVNVTADERPVAWGSSLQIVRPVDRAVFQRDDRGVGKVPFAVTLQTVQADTIEVRVVDRQSRSVVRAWRSIGPEAELALPGGWYQLDCRALQAGRQVAAATVDHVGVGEVFVTCGQSNSANYGRPRQTAESDRVSAADFQTGHWQHSADPQPGATGGGGSPWPLLGDLLVKTCDVPVGFVCVGVGSTTVSYWRPSGKGYQRLRTALQRLRPHGCRAVLWHQGESDSIIGTSAEAYASMLEKTIVQSRQDAGWNVPWGVALASFHPKREATVARQAAVVAGQRQIAARVAGVFQGPETDSFHTRGMLSDSVHFNDRGLAAHAKGWAAALAPLVPSSSEDEVRP